MFLILSSISKVIDFVNIFNFTAGRAVGGGVSEVNHFDFTADSGQTAFTGADDNGSILSFIGNDNIQVFINGILLKQSDYTISNNNTAFLLFVPKAVNGKLSSLKLPHDFNRSEGSTLGLTGYSKLAVANTF